MSKIRQLINCHAHSDSSLDGAATVAQIAKRTAELGAPYMTLTEHGHLNSAMELYTQARKANLKPILGIEAYLVNPFHDEYVEIYRKAFQTGTWKPVRAKQPEAVENEIQKKAMNQYLHITIHFKDEWAYKYFCGLSKAMWNRAVKKFGELKPMITLDELRGAAGHITIGSGCMKGPVQNFLLPSRDGVIKADPQKSELMYQWIREIAGPDGLIVEVFPHSVTHEWQRAKIDPKTKAVISPGVFKPNECTCDFPDGDLQKPLNQFALALSSKYKDKAVISLDSHFALPEQKMIQDCRLGNGQEAFRFHENYYILSTDEAAAKLKHTLGLSDKDIEQMVDNSYAWASNFDSFKIQTSEDKWILAGDADQFLGRLKSTIDKWGRMEWDNPVMMERLKKEIQVLAYNGKLNLLAYFATVEDIATFCRENDVLINVRGSAGGSLLLYLIGVSAVNPLKHDLSFERFLTEGRIKANTLPDADIDVSDQEKVIDYLKSKYGENICRLSTDLLLRIKSSLKDAERAMLGSVRPTTEALCRTLPSTPQGMDDHDFVFGKTNSEGDHEPGLMDLNPALKTYAYENPGIWQAVSEMLGIQRNKSSHACGFIIADQSITNYFPIIKVNDDWVTGYSPKSIESAGGVKFDLLGLNTLRDIQLCLKSIKERSGIVIDPWNLPYDEECFKAFAAGDTATVFQFDTPTVRPYLRKIKPTSVDGLAAVTALCRPGTLDAVAEDGRTLAETYVARSQGEPISYIHKDLEPIMKSTMGIQLFQEQTISIFKEIGGMSNEESEAVRRGIGKKDERVLSKATDILRTKALARGWTDKQVNLLIAQIMASARYSFNKSHAVSYAYVAYACMFLKTKYPLDWWKATLINSSKEEMANKFWKYIRDFTVLPDINLSTASYEIKGDKIVAPLSILDGIGEKAYAQLMEFVPYQSLEHFVKSHFGRTDKVRSAVHTGIVTKLIAAGILDSLFPVDMLVEQKLRIFEEQKAAVKGTTRVDPIPEAYIGMTSLGKYLAKKQLVSVYSEDLRSMVLSSRGSSLLPSVGIPNHSVWVTQDKYLVLDGHHLDWIKTRIAMSEGLYSAIAATDSLAPKGISISGSRPNERTIAVVGYVLNEKAFPYKGKSKQATKLVLDINGHFFDEVLWPDYGGNIAASGFGDSIVIAYYKINQRGISLQRVQSLVMAQKIETYNLV